MVSNGSGWLAQTYYYGLSGAIYALQLESAEALYVGGTFTAYNGAWINRIVRLNSDGTIDAGFAVGTGFNNDVFTLAVLADGSGDLYVGGDFLSYQATTVVRVIALNANGGID